MPSIIYNDDIETYDSSYYDGSNIDTNVSDDSNQGTNPSITPYPVGDTTSRPTDGWIIATGTEGGVAGETYNDTPPVEKPPLSYRTKTIKEKSRFVIHDYTTEYLRDLYEQGFKFYVVYADETEDEVSYAEIYNPISVTVGTYVNEAYDIANATNQHFWHDDNGAHVTDIEKDDWEDAVVDGFSDLSDSKPYHNILMNSLGILLRRALNHLVSISKSGIVFYDGMGNNISNILSSFGSEGAVFRRNGKTKVDITSQGLRVYDNSGTISGSTETKGAQVAFIGVDASEKPYSRIGKSSKGYIDIGVNSNDNGYIDFYNGSVLLAHIGYDAGFDKDDNVVSAPYYSFGYRGSSTIGNYSFTEGYNTIASGFAAHAEGESTTASKWGSHAEGNYTNASASLAHSEGWGTLASGRAAHAEGGSTTASNNESHAEGNITTASGVCSHAEGDTTTASGRAAHAEGSNTNAIGNGSHAEGYYTYAHEKYSHVEGNGSNAHGEYSHAEGKSTEAYGNYTHVEGCETYASGIGSHASGLNTSATYDYQFVCGKYNRVVSSLFLIGNGTSDTNRKNAFTVLSSGSAYFNGTTSANGTAVTSDARIKTLIEKLDFNKSSEFIKQLKPKHYYKNDIEDYGFYAQEVEEIPNFGNVLVTKDNTGVYDLEDFRLLNYQGMIAPMVATIQGLLDKVEALEKENKSLKEELNTRLDRIEKQLNI